MVKEESGVYDLGPNNNTAFMYSGVPGHRPSRSVLDMVISNDNHPNDVLLPVRKVVIYMLNHSMTSEASQEAGSDLEVTLLVWPKERQHLDGSQLRSSEEPCTAFTMNAILLEEN